MKAFQLGILALSVSASMIASGLGDEVKSKSKTGAKIDAKNLSYNEDKSVATFTGGVRFRSSELDIDCEKLVVTFKKNIIDDSQPALDGAKERSFANLKKAEATGADPKVIVVKRTLKDESIVHCGAATYDFDDSSLTAKKWPTVSQGGKVMAATESGTLMKLDKGNTLKADGGLRTKVFTDNLNKK